MQTTSIKKINGHHNEWKNALGFYKDELSIFNNRLTEVAARNTTREIMQMEEHFQNQFLIQAENIDILKHDINEHLKRMQQEAQLRAGHIDKGEIPIHFLLKERFENEEKVYAELKQEFDQFLSKVM